MRASHDEKVASSNLAREAHFTREIKHGDRCECLILAAAMGGDRKTLSFEFCRRVLQKRWGITCRHGEITEEQGAPKSSEKWRDLGPIDPVKVILIKNG